MSPDSDLPVIESVSNTVTGDCKRIRYAIDN